jgi:hypothetical protein
MKILNIDKLAAKEGRELVLFGVPYAVESMSVGNFIETTKAAEALADEPSLVKQIEATIDMVLRSVPSVERSVLAKLNLEQLQSVVAFVRGDEVEGAEVKAAGVEGVEKK